jgi:CubicO group peptidase (beta-lactamase class C family)
MTRTLLILLAVVSMTSTFGVRAADDPVLDRFASYLESLRAQAEIPGLAASVVGSGGILLERGFGRQNVEPAVFVTPDTPFHLDGSTQLVTAALVLGCAEDRRLSLDDRLDHFSPNASEPAATLKQVLSHTNMQGGGLTFSYRPKRYNALTSAVAACKAESFRKSVAELLDQRGMRYSVPGPDAATLPSPDGFDQAVIDQYRRVISNLATGYTVNGQGTIATTSYSETTLTPSAGLITTVHDFARFDVALKQGVLLGPESIQVAWTPPVGRDGRPLPHGLGWFVQSYNGQTVVWQFGEGNASSSLIVTVPARGLTMILLANSNGLAKGFNLAAGDVSVSPFAKAFLGTFLR